MVKKPEFLVWFDEVGKGDVALVGGKGANLGEMIQAGIPVPPGFITTAPAYFYFLEKNNLREELVKKLSDLDINDSKKLQKTSEEIKKMIESSKLPKNLEDLVLKAYRKIPGGKNPYVAVRSSATAEDLPDASFAGQQRTYLNVQGEKNLLRAVLGCIASLFEARAIFYRESKGFDHFQVGIAVPVQKMVQSEVSGVMFTVDPISNDPEKIAIEAAYGLGEVVVSGAITPDQYVVQKSDLEIIDKQIVKQDWQLTRKKRGLKEGEDPNVKLKVSPAYQKKQKLSDENIVELAKIAKKLEDHYQHPQDVEWAYEDKKIYLVQTRPVTTLKMDEDKGKVKFEEKEKKRTLKTPVLEGLGASPGIGIGPVQVIKTAKEIDKVDKGEILVTGMTTPDFVPAMKRATAIVTDKGGRTCHAAIVSRELGIPCVVGTEKATQFLRNKEIISVDGFNGKVYQGEVKKEEITEEVEAEVESGPDQKGQKIKTATKIYVNLGEPELAQKISKRDVDGVGLLRAEFMIANIGEHPRALIEQGKEEVFIDKLSDGLLTFAKSFDPRPVIYRATDFKTNEYKNLKGGKKFEPDEPNPMIGYRGCLRYITDDQVFRLELKAIKRVRRYHKNLWMMVPFVRTPEELLEAKKIMDTEDLYRTSSFKLFMMVEIPSNIILMDKFIGIGIDGISIGSNDLTQLILGVDRDNPRVAETFDERNESVLWALEKAIRTASEHGISSSICGQAPSDYPEITRRLVEWGISSISVNPDVIEKSREVVAEAEMKLIKQGGFLKSKT